jgi:hypothetical protein
MYAQKQTFSWASIQLIVLLVCLYFFSVGWKIFYVRLYFREALREEWGCGDTGFPMLSIQTNSYAYNRKMIFPIDR